MPATTALPLITSSFELLNVYLPGEVPEANDGQTALGFLNRMLGNWAQRGSLIPVVSRQRFDMIAGRGGPYNGYTIGVGGDLNTARPPNQNSIVGANLILTATTPTVRTPLAIFTTESYAGIGIPDLSNAQPTGLYYNPTYSTLDYGSVHLWPVPSIASNDLELFINMPLTRFADINTTSYYLPEGWEDAIVYGLAVRLATPFGRTLDDEAKNLARSSLAAVKRSSLQMTDLPQSLVFSATHRNYGYNIQTDQS